MVAFNEVGQGYFTFEELDLVGAIADLQAEIEDCKVEAFNYEQSMKHGFKLSYSDLNNYAECLTRPFKLMAVIDLLRRYQ